MACTVRSWFFPYCWPGVPLGSLYDDIVPCDLGAPCALVLEAAVWMKETVFDLREFFVQRFLVGSVGQHQLLLAVQIFLIHRPEYGVPLCDPFQHVVHLHLEGRRQEFVGVFSFCGPQLPPQRFQRVGDLPVHQIFAGHQSAQLFIEFIPLCAFFFFQICQVAAKYLIGEAALDREGRRVQCGVFVRFFFPVRNERFPAVGGPHQKMQVWVEVLVVPGTYHAQIVWRNVIRLCQFVGFQRNQVFHVIAVYPQPFAVAGVERIHMIPDRAVAGSLDVCLCRQHPFLCTVLVEDGALPVDIGNVVGRMTRIGEIAGVEYRFDLHFFTSLSAAPNGRCARS